MNDVTFDKNNREEIERALIDPDPENLIAKAVAARMVEFAEYIDAVAERNGHFPTELPLRRPETAFDDIVIRLTLQTLANEIGHTISIYWICDK